MRTQRNHFELGILTGIYLFLALSLVLETTCRSCLPNLSLHTSAAADEESGSSNSKGENGANLRESRGQGEKTIGADGAEYGWALQNKKRRLREEAAAEEMEWRIIPRRETAFGKTSALMKILPASKPEESTARRGPPAEQAPPRRRLPQPIPQTRLQKPRVALIIDDIGFVYTPTEDFLKIEAPLTIAVLPWGKYSRLHAEKAKDRGMEVLLHLPLEPIDPETAPGPGVIKGDFTPEEIIRQLRANLEAVPGVTGVNNHMGSKGTRDPVLMRRIMRELKCRNLFFVDSMTVSASVAAEIAREEGVPVAVRDVFIDHYGLEGIREQLEELLAKAVEQRAAVGIAHARPGVAKAISEFLPRFAEAGVEIVPVSELVE